MAQMQKLMTTNQGQTVSQLLKLNDSLACSGCDKLLTILIGEHTCTVCPLCYGLFCTDCDKFAHSVLQQCPKC